MKRLVRSKRQYERNCTSRYSWGAHIHLMVPFAKPKRWLKTYRNELFSWSEIAQLQDTRVRIEQKVLRFYVTVTDAMRMNVSQGAKELIHIKFDQKNRDHLLEYTVSKWFDWSHSLPLLFHNFLQVCTNFRGPSLAPDLNTLHPESQTWVNFSFADVVPFYRRPSKKRIEEQQCWYARSSS